MVAEKMVFMTVICHQRKGTENGFASLHPLLEINNLETSGSAVQRATHSAVPVHDRLFSSVKNRRL